MQSLLQNIRFSLRMLTRNPGLTLTVLLTLAIGIGANTAIFTVDYSNASGSAALCETRFMMRLAFPRAGTSEKRRDTRAECHRCRIRARPTRVPPYWRKSQG
jgi:hypothetical protein